MDHKEPQMMLPKIHNFTQTAGLETVKPPASPVHKS